MLRDVCIFLADCNLRESQAFQCWVTNLLRKCTPNHRESSVSFFPTVKAHQVHGKMDAAAALLALIVLLIIYSVMGWWALT
jgi:hypothetical protein